MHRAPFETGSRSGYAGIPPHRGRSGDHGETDFYLNRSYAIVERLRRAVAERDLPLLPSAL